MIRLHYRSPRADAFAERWVGTVRREVTRPRTAPGPLPERGEAAHRVPLTEPFAGWAHATAHTMKVQALLNA